MKYGTEDVDAAYVGEDVVDRIYFGEDLVWEGGVPTLLGYVGFNGVAGSSGGPSDTSWNPQALVHSSYRWTAAAGESLKTVEVYGSGYPSPIEIALYVYSGGVPTTRVMSPTIVTLGTTPGWYSTVVDVSLTAGVTYVLAADYWVGDVFTGGPGVNIRYDNSGGGSSYMGIDNAAGAQMPTTWSQSSTNSDRVSFRGEVWSS